MTKILSFCSLLGIFSSLNAQVNTIEEDFSTFTDLYFPQKGWNKKDFSREDAPITTRFQPRGYIRTNSFYNSDIAPVYIITPEITSIDGVKSLKFSTWTRRGTGKVQVGVSNSPDTETIADNFIAISEEYQTDIVEPTKLTYSVSIPRSDAKFIVFKLIPDKNDMIIFLDDVYYKQDENLSIQNISHKNISNIIVDSNGQLSIQGNDFISVKIYNASGNIVLNEKFIHSRINISHLNSGIYFISLQHKNGYISNSKFIKTK